jgi:ArsR family transcriptional regulator
MTYDKFKVIEALGSETRYKIVALLLTGAAAVETIAGGLGIAPSAVSQQLRTLYSAGIVTSKKDSRYRIYQIAKSDAGKAARAIMRV